MKLSRLGKYITLLYKRNARINDLKLIFTGIQSDTSELNCILNDGMYEKVMIERFVEEAKTSKCFFDVGGNIGFYNVAYFKSSKGKAYVWEPIARYRIFNLINQFIQKVCGSWR